MANPPMILVVEDEPAVVEVIQEILMAHGYQVDAAGDGLAALKYLEKKRFDLALIDVVMPGMGGMELLRQISLLYPETMTIMLTGYSSIKDAVAAIKLGAYDYIAKPVHPEAIILTIERALQFKSLREATRELEWTLKGAEALGLQVLELAPEVEEFKILEQLRLEAKQIKDRHQLARLFLEKAQTLAQASRGSIFLCQPDKENLTCAAQSGGEGSQVNLKPRRPGEGVMGYVLQHNRPLLVTDVRMDHRFFEPPRSQQYRTPSFLVVPIIKEKLWGVINLADRQDLQPFTTRELFLIWLLAQVFAEILILQAREEESRRINKALVDTQSELVQMKDYVSQLNESMTVGLAVLDQEFRLCSTNPAFADLLDQDVELLLGKELLPQLSWLASADREQLFQALQAALYSESPLKLDQLDLIHPSRGNRIVSAKMFGFRSEPGQPKVLMMLEDITEIEQMRQRLAISEQLAIMGKLSACVIHELNNPLDGVMRYISLALLKKEDYGEVERYLTEAQKGLNRISNSVKSMLSLSQPHQVLKAQDTVLSQLREAVKILTFQANDQGVEISLEFSPAFDQILVGSDLYMVFVNLIKNALNAMPQGGELQIVGIEDWGRLLIKFVDTGEGIAPQNLEKIFKPFFTTKKEGHGMGLGLSICEKIIERYQGRIKVDSIPRQGTTVTIELPRPVTDWSRNLK
ncbi:MAG: response regulator [Deltaproteobacteria bacterium]|nr:response regulator [Deltaproteobacteria bacterium]MBW1953047.1 response regulator [Deltaproteobacteria bacterium]MBW1985923.1 response regulator [Deltaproteobacteria bacterium]MBW2133683.1 response regulator [Deltaproteobacteria bacterium]